MAVLLPALSAGAQQAADGESAAGWFQRVDRTQSAQPHWITPLVTVTPRLEEEFRFDVTRQQLGEATTTTSFGGGKGLELIPAERIEVILGMPPYLDHRPTARNGFGDESFLLKYRLLAANEHSDNYILTFFLGSSVATGSKGNGAGHTIFTPTIAFGKGWRKLDVQTTLGIGLPGGDKRRLGTPVTHNIAFQYQVIKHLWPELEVNSTLWPNGSKDGKKQVFLTPGIVVGRFRVRGRLGLTVGLGVQIAATSYRTYDHNWIFSARLPF